MWQLIFGKPCAAPPGLSVPGEQGPTADPSLGSGQAQWANVFRPWRDWAFDNSWVAIGDRYFLASFIVSNSGSWGGSRRCRADGSGSLTARGVPYEEPSLTAAQALKPCPASQNCDELAGHDRRWN